ncbi:MAG: DNA mismatch repair endonuclease MutL, partial [Clostridia bacterium]|nr:DNA mismatch repair endonuclease MutL [Clostridia bacterium]
MGKINVLQPNVFNMLAAGEVVERPSSVVKELIENSLDAGATEINVVIEQGGIRKIQVSDNGIGILKEDLRNAFLPHATSKLSNIDDLDSLATLGFRGEALASIASVSEVTLISASKAQGTASKITLSGGNVTFEGQDSRGEGTIITVENLFFNTPARLKFLKKPSAEGRQILDTVRMLVLANPNIRITLSDEEGIMLSSEGGTLADAICSVYGAKTVDNLRQIQAESYGSIKVGGYVSACDFTKPNRAYQTVIVNGRVVQDMTVQTAAEKAYGDYLMKRNYPMYVLDIIMPFDEVDSNVHPSKTEVRFVDKQRVFSAVYHAVLDTIKSSLGESKFGFNISVAENSAQNNDAVQNGATLGQMKIDEAVSADIVASGNKDDNVAGADTFIQSNERIGYNLPYSANAQPRIDTSALYHGKNAPKGLDFSAISFSDNGVLKDSSFNPYLYSGKNEQQGGQKSELSTVQNNEQEVATYIFDGKIIGQVFATYLLVERDNKLYVIDQHAAHERILYDRLVSKFEAKYSQSLLIPYRLTLTASESEHLERIIPQLETLGFSIENTGSSYLVKAVPESISDMSFQKLFGELFANMLGDSEITLEGLLKDSICQMDCKA